MDIYLAMIESDRQTLKISCVYSKSYEIQME